MEIKIQVQSFSFNAKPYLSNNKLIQASCDGTDNRLHTQDARKTFFIYTFTLFFLIHLFQMCD